MKPKMRITLSISWSLGADCFVSGAAAAGFRRAVKENFSTFIMKREVQFTPQLRGPAIAPCLLALIAAGRRPPDAGRRECALWWKELEPRNLINNYVENQGPGSTGKVRAGSPRECSPHSVEHDFTFLCRCTVFLVQFYKLNQLVPIDVCFQINNVCSVYLLFIR